MNQDPKDQRIASLEAAVLALLDRVERLEELERRNVWREADRAKLRLVKNG